MGWGCRVAAFKAAASVIGVGGGLGGGRRWHDRWHDRWDRVEGLLELVDKQWYRRRGRVCWCVVRLVAGSTQGWWRMQRRVVSMGDVRLLLSGLSNGWLPWHQIVTTFVVNCRHVSREIGSMLNGG